MEETLTEEEYQKINKNIRITGIIIALLGLFLVGGGIYFKYVAEQSSGIFTLITGICLIILGLVVRFVMGSQKK